ncbi:MAG TPA: hypothetical protein VHP32_06770 [Ignavibacteria bacterium]|nr:hypothetical protein [Ignavibacteria bacterium]
MDRISVKYNLSPQERKLFDTMKEKQITRLRKRYERRKRNHFNNERLKELFAKLNIEYSDKLYSIPFKCYFSLYLYLILKGRVKFLEFPGLSKEIKLAIHQNVNFRHIAKEWKVSRNTVRKAYDELYTYNLIQETVGVPPKHKSIRICIVNNDSNIAYYNDVVKKVLYKDVPNRFNTI